MRDQKERVFSGKTGNRELLIGIINFWSNAPEVSKLKGELSDLLLFSNIDEIVAKSDKIVTEITALAKVRHQDILS